jgi:hypothetical protein
MTDQTQQDGDDQTQMDQTQEDGDDQTQQDDGPDTRRW